MPRKLKKIWPTEKQIQQAIMQYLDYKGIWNWRNNSGMMFQQYKGKSYAVRLGLKGSPDIFGVLPGGKWLAIEVKDHKGIVSPEQQEFIDNLNSKGGLAFVARTLEEVMEKI